MEDLKAIYKNGIVLEGTPGVSIEKRHNAKEEVAAYIEEILKGALVGDKLKIEILIVVK